MPIYEYRSKGCGRVTEALLRTRSEADNVRCEHCGGRDLARVYLSPAAPVGASSKDAAPCCGELGGCDSPRRCCENR